MDNHEAYLELLEEEHTRAIDVYKRLRMLTYIKENGYKLPMISLQRLGYTAKEVRDAMEPFLDSGTCYLSVEETGEKTPTGLREKRTFICLNKGGMDDNCSGDY